MEKSKRALFIILLLFIFLIQCSQKKENSIEEHEDSTNSILDLADSEIYDFSYKYTNKEKKVWELSSKKAEVYNKKGLIKITGVNLNFYKNNKVDTTIVSKFGEIYEEKKILTAITNVVLTTEDGTILYTDILNWDDNRNLLYTDEFVKIVKKNGDVIRGIGLEADHNLEKLVIKKNATGKFYEKK